MLRLTLIEIILFLLPFAVYGAWRLLQTNVPADPRPMPSVLLGVIGGLLAAIGLVALVVVGERTGDPGSGRYVPARIENGEMQRGGFASEGEQRRALPGRPFGTETTRDDEDPGAFDSPDADPAPEPDVPEGAETDAPPPNPTEHAGGDPQ